MTGSVLQTEDRDDRLARGGFPREILVGGTTRATPPAPPPRASRLRTGRARVDGAMAGMEDRVETRRGEHGAMVGMEEGRVGTREEGVRVGETLAGIDEKIAGMRTDVGIDEKVARVRRGAGIGETIAETKDHAGTGRKVKGM